MRLSAAVNDSVKLAATRAESAPGFERGGSRMVWLRPAEIFGEEGHRRLYGQL